MPRHPADILLDILSEDNDTAAQAIIEAIEGLSAEEMEALLRRRGIDPDEAVARLWSQCGPDPSSS